MRLVCWIWAVFFFCAPVWAQLPAVEAYLDTTRATLGDPIELRLEVHYPPAYKPLVPAELELPADLQVEALGAAPEQQGEAANRQLWRYRLKSFVLGAHQIPSQAVQFVVAGDTLVRYSPDLEIEVISVRDQAEGQEPRDIQPPVEIPGGIPLWLVVVLGVGLLVAVILGVLWYLDRRGRGPVSSPPPVPIDYSAELARVELVGDDFKSYYSQLADLLRRFIEERLAVEALERTTGEIVRALRRTELEEAQIMAIGDFLSTADLVKFARFTPVLDEAHRAPEAAVALVQAVDAFKERQRRLVIEEDAAPSQ
ncbi:MAG: hypothetical protein GKR89_00680 [Candidatus Latescibacteria bacterium]|nr:hypothetical protein [Candidatus Latescibacterota bacterium]